MLAILLISPAALAEVYLGAAAGMARQELVCKMAAPCDKRAAAIRALGGWQFSQHFGVEFSWARTLGDFTASDQLPSFAWNGKFLAQVFGASATATFDTGPLDLQLRAGVASVRGEFHSRTAGVPDSGDTRVRATMGLGLKRAINEHWKLRVDLDLADVRAYTRDGHHTSFTIGLERHF